MPVAPDESGNPPPVITTETVTFRDGRIYTWSYEGGVIVSRTITDPEGAKSYPSIGTDDATDRPVTRRVEELDDGILVAEVFTNGVRTGRVMDDAGDQFAYDTIEHAYDAARDLIDTRTTFDDLSAVSGGSFLI